MSTRSPLAAFAALLRRDLTLALRRRSEAFNPLLFFVVVVSLFPLALGTDERLLRELAPGVVWVAALLASLLSLENLFRSDFEDGALEQILLSPHPVALLVIAKILAHWLTTGLPLLILAPALGLLVHLPAEGIAALVLTLLIGTPVLSLVGAVGVALTVGLRRGGVLLSLLVLPLYIPVLIFGSGIVRDALLGLDVTAPLLFLIGLLVFTLTVMPLAAGAALRVSTP